MLATLTQSASSFDLNTIKASHILVILPKLERLPKKYIIPGFDTLKKLLDRRQIKLSKISQTPVSANLENGALCSWVMIDTGKTVFEQQTVVRKALQLLLKENPEELHLAIYGNSNQKFYFSEIAVYTAWVNGAALPVRKQKPERTSLTHIYLHGCKDTGNFTLQRALAEGNLLARGLTVLPPNELTPQTYCEQIKKLAENEGWTYEAYHLSKLKKMGAGAFSAVAQGSDTEDAAIVHLHFSGNNQDNRKHIALVGKGICYDTGGHNLKSSRHMLGMHEDMNGSAVALGILLAATRAKMPFDIDCWLAIAQNHISPRAYKQNDVITALNGLTIEIIHTDAEGRMVLADTLSLAEKQKPDIIIDFATLTGSMHTALGSRISGIFCNQENLTQKALLAGKKSGERVCTFPMEDDYDAELESDIADVKQCALGGEYDHILAARFLSRFVNDTPWIHMDLSASSHKDGLGAVGSEVTGFGVNWAVELFKQL
ncbi:MAG: leucyl aminopeptidase family protein [Burkholderiales bacterium]|uniref:M17 family metallopeptidase n=1 Tax=Nitrosomonas sp. TaxID=42353 RepID=UPI001D21D46C|nr:leucyl aminopeptidase family protein [Nitrosomonas sp.]MCB1947362.1 leucyl aminopeptidase family protein [Nitrosomonas sp.]MCP5243031.1 leucyl aminopeptidase family protein [Burkholderiales bacterium]MCP5291654.1 leucyl aminopeptidase family protein [Burkholderiales bacterium]